MQKIEIKTKRGQVLCSDCKCADKINKLMSDMVDTAKCTSVPRQLNLDFCIISGHLLCGCNTWKIISIKSPVHLEFNLLYQLQLLCYSAVGRGGKSNFPCHLAILFISFYSFFSPLNLFNELFLRYF